MVLPDGESLAYIDRGERSGSAVVLIHGYTDNARDWVRMLPYLSKHYRLILVDIRGHGRSSKPECCYTRLDFAYDIKLLLDALGVQKADIVGHSLGSIIAQTFAEYWPERTAHVVLISSTGGFAPRPAQKAPPVEFSAQGCQLQAPRPRGSTRCCRGHQRLFEHAQLGRIGPRARPHGPRARPHRDRGLRPRHAPGGDPPRHRANGTRRCTPAPKPAGRSASRYRRRRAPWPRAPSTIPC